MTRKKSLFLIEFVVIAKVSVLLIKTEVNLILSHVLPETDY